MRVDPRSWVGAGGRERNTKTQYFGETPWPARARRPMHAVRTAVRSSVRSAVRCGVRSAVRWIERACPSDQSVGPAWSVRYGTRRGPSDLATRSCAPARPIRGSKRTRGQRPSDENVRTHAVRWIWYGPIEAVRSGRRPLYASSALGGQYKWRTAFFVRSERRWAW